MRGLQSDELTRTLPRREVRLSQLNQRVKENGFSAAAKAICPEEIRRNMWQKNGFREMRADSNERGLDVRSMILDEGHTAAFTCTV